MHGPARRSTLPAGALEAVLVGGIAGVACQTVQAQLWGWPAYAVLPLAGLLLPLAPGRGAVQSGKVLRPSWLRLLLLTLAAACVSGGLTGLRACLYQAGGLDPALEGRDLWVTGVIADLPQVHVAGTRFRLEVESATLQGRPVRLPDRLALGWYGGSLAPAADGLLPELQQQPLPLQAGERWQMAVRLRAPHGHRNPHGFDYELWLWTQGVQATGYVRAGASDPPARMLGPTGRHPVARIRQQVRDRIFAAQDDARTAGVIAALVVGDQQAIAQADWDVFRATGVAHLMSISGLHVTMFAWAAAALVGGLWRGSPALCLRVPAPVAARAGGLLLAMAYAVFSGWAVPAQRTVWMLAVVVLLRLSARRWPWPSAWLLVAAAVLLIDPWALTQAGFWLSFIAVGVLFAAGTGHGTGDGARPVRQLRALLREQAVLGLALAPLSLLLFGQVSLVGLGANLLAIPWVTLVVTPLALLGVLLPPAWDIAAGCIEVLAQGLQLLARWRWATVGVPQAPLWAGLAAVAGGVVMVLPLPAFLRLVGMALVLPALAWQAERPPSGEFSLLAADIGQGNAVLVRTAHHALLYDAGPRYARDSDAGHRVLLPLLRALGVDLDLLVVSHRDSDHAGGAASVLAAHPRAGLLSSVPVAELAPGAGAARRCEAGQRWQWDGVTFQVLHPEPADYASPARPNALSCVLRISSRAGGPAAMARTALLAGDIERPQELRLVARAAPLQADLLLVPHHGSNTSSSAEFLDAVAPRVALVQAGYRNRFGHPAPAPLRRLRERDAVVHASPRCGAARWTSEHPLLVRCERDEARRYWHHGAP